MKKVGDYVVRSQVASADSGGDRIQLFDGRFDTAYRITDFKVWGANWSSTSGPDVIGKLSKNDDGSTSSASFMRADDDNQIAWAVSAASTDSGASGPFNPSIVDKDNLVVEDLFVYVRTSGSSSSAVNYLITMEKYEISDWQGALAMARDRAQGDL